MSFDPTHYWAVCHELDGWLVDTGVGGTYSPRFEAAGWYRNALEARETLVACDLLDPDAAELVLPRWTRVGAFLIVQIS